MSKKTLLIGCRHCDFTRTAEVEIDKSALMGIFTNWEAKMRDFFEKNGGELIDAYHGVKVHMGRMHKTEEQSEPTYELEP